MKIFAYLKKKFNRGVGGSFVNVIGIGHWYPFECQMGRYSRLLNRRGVGNKGKGG